MKTILTLTGKRAIEQAIRNIILTPKGSVPFRPNFGLGIDKMIDAPYNPTQIRKQIMEQLKTYEPRIEPTKIAFTPTENVGHVSIAIAYKIKDTGEESAVII